MSVCVESRLWLGSDLLCRQAELREKRIYISKIGLSMDNGVVKRFCCNCSPSFPSGMIVRFGQRRCCSGRFYL